jgi:hypothetical protein
MTLHCRVATLERLVETLKGTTEFDGLKGAANSNADCRPPDGTSKNRRIEVDEKILGPVPQLLAPGVQPGIDNESGRSSNNSDLLIGVHATTIETPSIRTILSPVGNFRHEAVCKILLKALYSTADIKEAIESHSHFWRVYMRMMHGPAGGSANLDLKEYIRKAVNGDNPVKIAKAVQVIATATHDLRKSEELVRLVDRLIISDNEYLSTLDGLECAFEHGMLLRKRGQIHRAWYVFTARA